MGHDMVTFDDQTLFGPGPARFKIGPIKLRHAIQHPLGSRGVRIEHQGTEAREFRQTGVLIDDTPERLQVIIDAIESYIDGLPHTLVDSVGRTWNDTVMLEAEADPFVRAGARWKASYRITYLQVIV